MSGRGLGYRGDVPSQLADELLDLLKTSSATLRDAGIPFALGGGLAAWARGGPATEHDIDLLVRESDADAALDALAATGMRPDRPPEGWLLKAWLGDMFVDLIHHPAGLVVDDELLARCEEMDVGPCRMPVMPITDYLVTKLLILNEHHLDLAPALAHARALREQVDWPSLTARVSDSPYARAFLGLLRELGVVNAAYAAPEVRRGAA